MSGLRAWVGLVLDDFGVRDCGVLSELPAVEGMAPVVAAVEQHLFEAGVAGFACRSSGYYPSADALSEFRRVTPRSADIGVASRIG